MNILVCDDEPVQRELLRGFLEGLGHRVFEAEDGLQAVSVAAGEAIDLVLMDQRMPGMSGEEALERIKGMNPLVRCIMITAFGSVETAVTVMKLGADDFLEKPVDLDLLAAKLEELERELSTEQDVEEVRSTLEQEEAPMPLEMVAESRGMREVVSMARRVAPTPWTVLISGETGTGKEVVARLVHLLSRRNQGPFVEVNCATVPENLFESELFGHEKGAFTGAAARRIGLFETAHGGSIFLDEIGELPLQLQPKLLKAIQEKRITRLGSSQEIEIDVRVIAATNRNLREMVEEGRFREDLFFRLNVFEITIPPLRERREDIVPLAHFFKERYSMRPLEFSREALDLLVKYPFPGNVRELEHVIQRTVTLARGRIIRPSDLPPEIRSPAVRSSGPLKERLRRMEREMILEALERNGWVQTRAAQELGISERVLRYRMERLNIRRPQGQRG